MIQNKLTDDRGQVGIGTLIVFIALVLVAAIAAGVLINTAGFLQTQAEQTGEDSTDQVADNINVIGEVGEVSEESAAVDSKIYETRLTVQRSPGSSEIDLEGLSIQWVGDNGFAQLVHVNEKKDSSGNLDTAAGSGSAASNVYFVQAITAETSTDAVITADGDRYELVIPVGVTISVDPGSNTVSAVTDENTDSVVGTPANAYGADSDVTADITTEVAFDTSTGAEVVIDNEDVGLLGESQRAELEITTDSGATRNVVIAVPDTLIDQDGSTVTL